MVQDIPELIASQACFYRTSVLNIFNLSNRFAILRVRQVIHSHFKLQWPLQIANLSLLENRWEPHLYCAKLLYSCKHHLLSMKHNTKIAGNPLKNNRNVIISRTSGLYPCQSQHIRSPGKGGPHQQCPDIKILSHNNEILTPWISHWKRPNLPSKI